MIRAAVFSVVLLAGCAPDVGDLFADSPGLCPIGEGDCGGSGPPLNLSVGPASPGPTEAKPNPAAKWAREPLDAGDADGEGSMTPEGKQAACCAAASGCPTDADAGGCAPLDACAITNCAAQCPGVP